MIAVDVYLADAGADTGYIVSVAQELDQAVDHEFTRAGRARPFISGGHNDPTLVAIGSRLVQQPLQTKPATLHKHSSAVHIVWSCLVG